MLGGRENERSTKDENEMKPQLEVVVQKPDSRESKTPLLFVHGMWHAAWCWEENFLPYFAQNNHASYAVSLRGHGKSEGRNRLRWTSLTEYATDVAAVVEQIGRPPVLIGHSMGGMVVQKYLETHQAPAAVLLASISPKGVLPATLRTARHRPIAFLRINLTMSLYPVIETPKHCKAFLFSDSIDREQLMEYYGRMQDESYRAYIDMLFLNLSRPQRVKTPMLVLGAANDAAISVKENLATAQAYGVKAEIFPNIAHNMMLEAGWRTIADRILSWLEEKGL